METDQVEMEYRGYEVSFLGLTEQTAAEVEALVRALPAEIALVGPAKQITLAYPIAKHRTAFFGYFHFSTLPSQAIVLKEQLALNTNIIRSLILTPYITKAVERVRPMPMEQSMEKSAGEKSEVAEEKTISKPSSEAITNELLEQKLEEILQ